MRRRHVELDSRARRVVLIMAGTLVLLLIAVLLLGCGDDNPTGPSDGELKDYRVWFTDVGRQDVVMLYEYHPTTRMLDSMALPWMDKGPIRVSADGSLLFFASGIFDPESGQEVGQLPYGRVHDASRDGNYLACKDGDYVVLLRASDYSVAYRDATTPISGGVSFSYDGGIVYGASGAKTIAEMRPVGDSFAVTHTTIENDAAMGGFAPTPDNSKWFLYGKAPFHWTWKLSLYDVILDSIVFEYYHQPGAAYLAMAPDGRYLYFGNPGTLIHGPGPPPYFKVFDIQANDIVQTVYLDAVVNGVELMEPKNVGDMVITPDGRWLVTLNAIPGLQLRLYDLTKQKWVDYKSFGTHNVYLAHLAVQSAP